MSTASRAKDVSSGHRRSVHRRSPPRNRFPRGGLDKCLSELSPESRKLIRFFSEVKLGNRLHRRISQGLEMTQTALRMRVRLIKQKLKICVQRVWAEKAVTKRAGTAQFIGW